MQNVKGPAARNRRAFRVKRTFLIVPPLASQTKYYSRHLALMHGKALITKDVRLIRFPPELLRRKRRRKSWRVHGGTE